MEARLKLKPGQRGTKKLLAQYGDKLVCVRYRYDVERKKRYKTVELIVEAIDWQPSPKSDAIMYVRTAAHETDLHQRIRQAGGKWDSKRAVWKLRFDQVRKLRLKDRVVLSETI